MISLDTTITELPKMGTTQAKALNKVGVKTIRDLLFYFPFRYLDFSKFSKISDAKPGEIITIRGKIKTIQARFSFKTRRSLAEAIVSDETGSIKVVWYNQGYLAKSLKPQDEVLLSGSPEQYKGLQMTNPVHELFVAESIHTGRIVPIYHITDGLYHRAIRNLVKTYLHLAKEVEDPIPSQIIKNYSLLSLPESIEQIHFPSSDELLERSKFRIIFEEVFIQQLAVKQHKLLLQKARAPEIAQNIPLIKKFLATLPFELTSGQKKALWEIIQDLEGPHPMNRLLEGDVGSGKTLVAMAACFEAVAGGFQAAILAPTEILAKQHYETFYKIAQAFDKKIKVSLLTNHFHLTGGKETTKDKLKKEISSGKIDLVIGTHAIIQGDLDFKNLGLAIIDEQHRFGVEQRALLLKNISDTKTEKRAHLLSMSATPIPRTLALSFYGDLNISTLTQMPKGRQTIVTSVVPENKRQAAYDFIKKEITAGRQAFIVTPRVENSETSTVKSAKAEAERLHKEIFSQFRLGLIHGKLKGAEKEKIMNSFYDKSLDVLVATSVIEIGIDVPNASVMLIEDAERFGLAQLHQLRGRVGRGAHKSYCLLFTGSQDQTSLERLKVFSNTRDGFKLAEMDLKQRGFGSLFGTDQTGFNFRFSEYLNLKVLEAAKNAAGNTIETDPELHNYPLLKERTEPLLNQIHLE